MGNGYNLNDLYRKIINLPVMRSNQSFLCIKGAVIILLELLVLGIFPSEAFSQEIVHQYKITGAKRIFLTYLSLKERMVEYDPGSADHLFISELVDNGVVDKSQFLFKGNKFNLNNLQKYDSSGELVRDGLQRLYNPDKSIASELIYNNGTLLQQTFFYTNGQKQMTFLGDQNALNGKFVMWHPNGKISFLGNYKNNLKDGVFESYDESGNLERKGTYSDGKLITGESVVQDLVYDTPEVAAKFIDGSEAFYEYLKLKTANLAVVNEMGEGVIREFKFKLTVDKTGHINKLDLITAMNPSDNEIINSVLDGFPGFKPALMEGAPVRCILEFNLFLTNKGLQADVQSDTQFVIPENDSISDPPYTIVEDMPEFPGGDIGLLNFLRHTVKYPIDATKNNIQGKVFVKFIIREDGSINDIKIFKSAHPLLDAEAVRVTQLMPKWIPGKQDGKAVRVSYTIPINFVLE